LQQPDGSLSLLVQGAYLGQVDRPGFVTSTLYEVTASIVPVLEPGAGVDDGDWAGGRGVDQPAATLTPCARSRSDGPITAPQLTAYHAGAVYCVPCGTQNTYSLETLPHLQILGYSQILPAGSPCRPNPASQRSNECPSWHLAGLAGPYEAGPWSGSNPLLVVGLVVYYRATCRDMLDAISDRLRRPSQSLDV
jgi:hypothetical protein